MRVHHRLAALFAAAVLSTGVVACGGGEDDEGGGEATGKLANVPGFNGTTIKLGVLTPLTGPVAVIGLPLTAGNEVYFDAVNAKGGVAGKYKIELTQEDTQYKPDTTVQKYNKLKTQVVAFAQILGTPPTLATLPQLKRDKVIAAPASLDANWVPEQNLLPIGGPYQIQAINALDYYVKEGGGEGKNVCVMLQDDAYGEAGLEGVEFAAEKLGFEVASEQRYKTGDKDVTGQIQNLIKAKCDAVFLTAVPSDAGVIWGTAAKLKFAPRWIAQSPTWIDELGASPLKDYLAKTTWVASEGTEWGDESVPGMKQMVADVKAHKPDQEPDYYFAFGYAQARAMTALLEKAVELGDLSHEGLLQAMEQLGTVSFDGLTGDYQYGAERVPPTTTTIFEVDTSKPFALGKLAYQYESDIAGEFRFGGEG